MPSRALSRVSESFSPSQIEAIIQAARKGSVSNRKKLRKSRRKRRATAAQKSEEKKSDVDDNVYIVEKILKVKGTRKGRRKLLIRWARFGPEHDSWIPESYLIRPLCEYSMDEGCRVQAKRRSSPDKNKTKQL